MKNVWLLLLLLLCSAPPLAAQRDSTRSNDDGTDQIIEDAVIDSENDNQTDWSYLTDQLNDLKERPLNINTADKEDLLMLPGMTEILANSILDYVHQFGNLSSLYELQAVPGFTAAIFNRMKPYCVVREALAKDISPNTQHPAGPPIKVMLNDAKHELLLRWVTDIEKERGYEAPDSNSDGSLKSHYLGDRNKYYLRYRMRYNQNLSVALVGEKDNGEAFDWAVEI